jgi:DNA-directed RNA polymerase subunit H|uniref:RNA polymerase subunit H/Rpb5 C-terminal domain-containing protein n=1 Tax=viral metagenome TaxID=1070528 RepID=A0A6C0KS02_9ZZZZ
MASQNSSLISHIYKSRNVILDLVEKQGFSISDYKGFSINEVNTMKLNNQLDMILEKDLENEQKAKIYIKYYLVKSLRPNNLQEMIDDLFNVEEILTKNDTLFIIVKDEVNETLLNCVKHIWETDKIFIVIKPLKRLQFNILEHILVPPHRVISSSEKNEIKKRFNIINDEQFPQISRFDPVAQSIGIRPGEVCEIIRPSKTAISAPYYRICF